MTKKHTRRGYEKKDRPKFDMGTPELVKKRLMALGPRRLGWPEPNPSDAESALGVLFWQGALGLDYDRAKRLHDAGVAFAGWWTLVHPKSHTQGTLGQFAPKTSSGEVDTAEAEANLRSASVCLKRERHVYDAVVNTCVYQQLNYGTVAKLKTGLGWLFEWQREQREAA